MVRKHISVIASSPDCRCWRSLSNSTSRNPYTANGGAESLEAVLQVCCESGDTPAPTFEVRNVDRMT
jgi:hypothetical protein